MAGALSRGKEQATTPGAKVKARRRAVAAERAAARERRGQTEAGGEDRGSERGSKQALERALERAMGPAKDRGRGGASRRSKSAGGSAPDKNDAELTLGDPPITIQVRRNRAARRLSLSVSHLDGRARVTAPTGCRRSVIEAFVREHQTWLESAVERAPDAVRIAPGAEVPFCGRPLRVVANGARAGVRLDWDVGRIEVGGPEATVGRRVAAWLREEARARLLERSQARAAQLGLSFRRISIRDTRSRWGSCTYDGALSYCWRLIMAPADVLDYVAAHEVAHLRELNHSPRFWAIVEELRPDWRLQRDWLRRHGASLHRYRV